MAEVEQGKVNFNRERPLDKIPGESQRALSALHDYALQGPRRSLRVLLDSYRAQAARADGVLKQSVDGPGTPAGTRPPTLRFNTLAAWSSAYGWQARVAAFDALAQAAEEELWRERRRAQREEEWTKGSDLLALAGKIIAETPRFVKTTHHITKAGQEIITIGLDGYLAVRALEAGAKLRRLAAGMETDRSEVTTTIVEVTPEQLADARKKAEEFRRQKMSESESDDEPGAAG